MMRREARWLRDTLAEMSDAELGVVLSVGSGSDEFRTVIQPWIHRDVFAPLAERGVSVLHHELVGGDGIDVDGDLMSPAVQRRLAELGVATILCLNVLEHVPQPALLAAALTDALPSGGCLVVTVPRRFPYHPDPIDTMFRPDASELTALFPALDVVDRGALPCESLMAYWLAKPGKVAALGKFARSAGTGREDVASSPAATESERGRRSSPGAMWRMAVSSTELTFAVMRRP